MAATKVEDTGWRNEGPRMTRNVRYTINATATETDIIAVEGGGFIEASVQGVNADAARTFVVKVYMSNRAVPGAILTAGTLNAGWKLVGTLTLTVSGGATPTDYVLLTGPYRWVGVSGTSDGTMAAQSGEIALHIS